MLQTQLPVPDPQWRPNKLKHGSLEKKKVYHRANQTRMNGWLLPRKPKLPDYFQGEVFNRQTLG